MKQPRPYLSSICISIFAMFLFSGTAIAETCKQWIAKVVSVQGNVQTRKAGEAQWHPVKVKDTYCPGDMIRVQERSRADILLINEAVLRIDQNTMLTFSEPEKERTSLVDLLKGAVYFFSRTPRSLKVITPFVNANVEGTEFFVKVESDKTLLSVFKGQVSAANNAGSITLTSGQSALAEAGKAPVLRVVVRPRDAVQWTLYYPPVLYYRPADFNGLSETDWQMMVRKSIEFYIKGDLSGAFASLAAVPEDVRDPRFFTYRAGLLLSVGRVDEAKVDIDKALSLMPSNSHAIALQSIIAVVQNEKEMALSIAKKAVETDPDSATARIALSYALQANFDLQGALNSLKDSVKLEPENAIAWARLSEMWLSFGDMDEALNAANKAVALNPDLARTQTVLGFAYLTQIRTKMSKDAFERAIELDQADPLPRLGLGLAEIREGELTEGRREIEIAASLDPNSSLIRSYLGKAYYEEKRDKLSSDQFNIAKELDPLDPTPFFYDAIRKQSINRPVEALHDLQKSIELNDTREIYRSRLLLDEDLAARSASLARIYSDLGFQQLALVEGWKSVNTDPANYSAHRFLSDSYSVLPRHEIARVSELLQSQLLQPININPVQPSLAESNLSILEGAGPSSPSFNEFNPLFNRNRLSLQLSGVAGSNSTFGDEVVVSGVHDKFSISAGQFHYQTDGFRENNDQKQDIYNVFTQMGLSLKTSVQAEFRYRESEKGDLGLNFSPDNFLPDFREKETDKSIRLGFHQAFSAGSDLVGSFIYRNSETKVHAVFTPTFVHDKKTDENSYVGELQHQFRRDIFHVISGAGYFRTDLKEVSEIEILIPPPAPAVRLSTPREWVISHTNLYLYSLIHYPKNLTFTVGGSADFFRGDFIDCNQFNPKLGLTWNPLPSTTLRAALFRTLKRMLVTDQTLEPTQVAGFNQFFDDANGTKSWVNGFAVDQKFSQNVFGGVEYYRRDLTVPFETSEVSTEASTPPVTVTVIRTTDWKEHLGRAYLYWTLHPWVAISTEYLYERFNRERAFVAGIEHVETHRFPLGVNFHHPCGFSAGLKAVYTDQHGSFQPQGSPQNTFVPGSDRFWIVDATTSYRLPKRLGIITLEAKNLFNKSFSFQDTDPVSPVIQPKRSVYLKFTVAL
jgi:tetratricopeptide (TPR) repeat protein/outer membrane receptor protein involved in Fe transport